MLKLTTAATEPRWLDLPDGARVLVRPYDTAVAEAAYAEAVERARPVKQAAVDAEAAGMPMDPSGANGANAAWVQGLATQYLCEAMARYAIMEWEGVTDADGAALPVTPEACAALARHPFAGRQFYQKYVASADPVAAEGNASAPSSGGAGAGAQNTAEGAQADQNGMEQTQRENPAPTAPVA